MSNLSYVIDYKQKIINLLLRNQNLVKLINPKPSECEKLDIADVLWGGSWFIDGKKYEEQGHVFDYNFVDDTVTEEKTFLFVETDVEYIKQSLFTDFNLYVYVFCSKNLVKITDDTSPTVDDVRGMGYSVSRYANRIDVMCDIIDGILSGNEKINGLGTVKPADRWFCSIYCPSVKYYGKCLKYHISNLYESGDGCENI